MLKMHQDRFKAAFEFLKEDLPKLKDGPAGTWRAFLANAHLDEAEARQVLTMDGSAPLIFPADLGTVVFGQFDPQIPGRIDIAIEVLNRFAAEPQEMAAQQFLLAKVLHEMCHWACFKKQQPDNDTAGEAFEVTAFQRELMPWWNGVPMAAPPMPIGTSANDIFNSGNARATLLKSMLGERALVPGRTADPNHSVFGGVDVAEALPRGYRNNNPGNIRVSASNWLGLADPVAMLDFQRREKSFCVFREPEWGLRALGALLRKYKTEHGLDTPRKIISRWAPASDNNDVESYARQLAKALSVTEDSVVDATDDDTLMKMMRAIARHENGKPPPYAKVQYEAAVRLL